MKNLLRLAMGLFLSLVLLPLQAAQKCVGDSWTPDSRFVLKGGEAYDTVTKLTWKRCAEGQSWNEVTCIGTAQKYTWNEAMKQFPIEGAAWRLPGADELISIRAGNDVSSEGSVLAGKVMSGCTVPAWNINTFGPYNGGESFFWSSSPDADNSNKAWVVFFNFGGTNGYDISSGLSVRLVRGELLIGSLVGSGKALTTSMVTMKKNRLEAARQLYQQAEQAAQSLNCEEALKLDRQAQVKDGESHYDSDQKNGNKINFSSCIDERKFRNFVNGKDPQTMYLAAGVYEVDGSRARAKTLYRQIVERFSKNQLAIKAADRLTRLNDVEIVESSNQQSASRIERAQQQTANQVQQARDEASQRRSDFCSGKSSCSSSCSGLSYGSNRDSCYTACSSKYSGC